MSATSCSARSGSFTWRRHGELRRGGKPVGLTALEFKLLAAFVRNQGRLLNRTQLLDLVWGTGTCVTDRVVDNHVVSLCRKIEPDATQKRDVFVLALADLREWPLITHPANDQMVG